MHGSQRGVLRRQRGELLKVNRGVVKKMKYDYEGLGKHTRSKHRMGERNNREIEREKKDTNWGNYTKGKLI